ncbi:vWA domain-containing protein [Ruminococcus sp. HUN007]|uniref:vWA domain-containing protein n=1 Tax=Ruminococcus sp. HUN007 TaxID=1514668 RepID=UPI0006797127|nr:vWA domain-containing protein [Ruminococcus sp. HUN007]
MKKGPVIVISAVICLIGAILGIVFAVTGNDKPAGNDKSGISEISSAEALKVFSKAAGRVSVTENHAPKGTVSYDAVTSREELPDIDTSYPLVVKPSGKELVVEIFSSPEKAGSGTDGWLKELAEEYNDSNQQVDGKTAGIALRSVSSGTQIDYIESGVYVPDAITPSASMWADMLEFSGTKLELISERMVGNVAGVLIDKKTYSDLESQYGSVDIQTVITATEEGKITAGYTNPFSSTSGLNFLAATLYSYDKADPLSAAAVEGFNKFQNNVPFVAYNTLQMRDAASNNTFTSFILEYQGYYNNIDLKNNYEFLPYGIRHDNPLYAVKGISAEKTDLLKAFSAYCSTDAAKKRSTDYGFNQLDSYKDSIPATDGQKWSQMQKVWKKNKNTAKPIAAVFVLDTSGSMSGEPINALKSSLTNSIRYINTTNYVGVISYASDVNIDLPIGIFDINQQALFQGAVDQLHASGSTATYSALAQASIMLDEFMKTTPNVQPMIFLLSDGEQNVGASFNDIRAAVKSLKTPIYTIGYNADLDELKKISSINEAASIDAASEDVVYQLKNLFNANL